MCLDYLNKVYENTYDTSINPRKYFRKLATAFPKIATGQTSLLWIALSLRNKFLASLKKHARKRC